MPRPRNKEPVYRVRQSRGKWVISWTEGGRTHTQQTGASDARGASRVLREYLNERDEPDVGPDPTVSDPYGYPPGLLSVTAAARWLGISASTLRTLVIPRRVLGARRLYDLRDLAAYRDQLPYEADEDPIQAAERLCDEVFGSNT